MPYGQAGEMKFKELTTCDHENLKPFFSNDKSGLCAYSLPSLIAWSTPIARPYFSIIDNDTLIIKEEFTKNPDKNFILMPICPDKTYTPDELKDLLQAIDIKAVDFVPEIYFEKFGKSAINPWFEIKEQTEYEDYVYNRDDLAFLKGKKYSKKRNLVNQFKRAYLDKGRVDIEPITARAEEECIDFLEKWCLERNCQVDENESLACEKIAAQNALQSIEETAMRGILLRIDGNISAFGMGSTINSEMGALHFEKAFAGVKGLYQFFDAECALQLFDGAKYINKESDMGEPGLAKAKNSYYPVMKLKSFKLTLK